jgi:hypothetical protein
MISSGSPRCLAPGTGGGDLTAVSSSGKNSAALPSAHGLPGGHRYRIPLVRWHRVRNGTGTPLTVTHLFPMLPRAGRG